MISANGFTWTSREETGEYCDRFADEYGAHAAATGFHRPCCEMRSVDNGKDAKYGCGKMTSYMVIMDTLKDKIKFGWLGIGAQAGTILFKADNMIFVPIPLCVTCEAKRSGYRAAVDGWPDPERFYEGVRKGPYTPEMVEHYITVFRAAYSKGCGVNAQREEERTKKTSKSRYTPQGAQA